MGLVRSVKVVAVPGGVRAPLSAEGGAGSEVPSALSTPPFSCRKRFLLNLALAFWNQTCKPIPIDFFTDACLFVFLFVCMSLFLLLRHLFDVWFAWQVAHITLQPGLLLVVPAHRQALHKGPGPSAKPWEICSLTCPTEATFCMATGVHFGWGVLGSRLKDEGKGWMSRFWLRLKAHLNHFKRLTRKEGKLHCPCHAACWCRLPSLSFLQGSLKVF